MRKAVTKKSPLAWTYLTNHFHVLICLYRDPFLRLWEVAEKVGITERAVQKIVADLEKDGVLERVKEGRRNRYEIMATSNLRHPLESDARVGDLLELLAGRAAPPTGVGEGRDG